MKKLMIFCFSILFTVLSALSCVNFSLDAVERMEKDKATILIEEPEGMSNKDFLARISDALGRHDIDIIGISQKVMENRNICTIRQIIRMIF